MTTTGKTGAILAMSAIILFTIVGLIFGTPQPQSAETFVGVLRTFAQDSKTRLILAGILIDVVLGVMAAMRGGFFDMQATARFYLTNVLPYVLGYLLVWIVVLLGLDTLLPAEIQSGLASVGGAMVLTSLTGSIINNLQRLTAPIVSTDVSSGKDAPTVDRRG